MRRVARTPDRWRSSWIIAGLLLASTLAPVPWRDPSESPTLGLDKVYHFGTHAALAAALAGATARPGRSGVALGIVGSAAYGFLLEVAQTQIPGRQYELGDVVAGTLGALVGGAILLRRRGTADVR